jgi:hypothetical protein
MSNKATGQFGISIIDPKSAKLNYRFTMPVAGGGPLTPTGSVPINGFEYGRPATVAPGAILADTTPIDMAWTIGPSHMLTVTCLRLNTQPGNFWLSPVFVGDWLSGSVTGAKATNMVMPTATENFSQFFPAGGIELSYNYPNAYLTAMGAASDRYWVVDVAYKWQAANGLGLGLGWTGKKATFDKEISVQTNSPYIEIFWQL